MMKTSMKAPTMAASHYGMVHFGDMAVEAVVLEDGSRGYVQRQLATAIGLHESRRGSQLKTLLSEIETLYDERHEHNDDTATSLTSQEGPHLTLNYQVRKDKCFVGPNTWTKK